MTWELIAKRETWEAPFTLGIVGLIFLLLIFTGLAPDLILIAGVFVLFMVGILSPQQALAGLSNESMITVAVLFVVGAGIRETGAIDWISRGLFGRPKSTRGAVARLVLPVTTLSAFMNNTPLVAMMIPTIGDWAKKQRIPVSKLMIPLSYAAILGGTCTLIGTSTNLVVNGLLKADKGVGLNMFDISWVGVPCALVGCAFLIFASTWLLPDRRPPISNLDDPREYTVEMVVLADSPLVNQTIEQAGLRHLPGVFLAEIDRDGIVLPAVAPEEKLRAGDRLVFVGVVESVVDLQKMRGLVPATDQVFKLTAPRSTRCLTEAVVSDTCPLVGTTIREGRFRSHYNAAIVAVARNGERLRQKIGDIVLRPGDTLLMESASSFVDEQRNRRDFFLVSRLEDSNPPRHDRARAALAILAAMVVLMGYGWLSPLQASLSAAAMMMITRCCSISVARRSIDLETLLAIAASFGLGQALETTGAARAIADRMIGLAAGDAWLTLGIVYLITLIVTELITNNAAAALMYPFAMAAAAKLDVNYMPFVIVVMMASSAGFATPIGYQTNLMVYGPGGYRFNDYVKIGVPMDILIGVICVLLTPLVWPFK
jgi:di/tricarboxylate transporter